MVFNPDRPDEHTATAAVNDDPYAAAQETAERPPEFYGELSIECWFCALVKGQGKVPFDANVHDRRSTAIDLVVMPLSDHNITNAFERSTLDWARDWTRITWPSLKALGITSLRDVSKGKWCKFAWQTTGEKYRANGGEERERTAFKFLALYNSEAECRAAYYADTGKQQPDDLGTEAIPGFESKAQPAEADNGSSKARETAIHFIKAYAKMNQFQVDATRKACATQSAITDVFDLDSPEFVEVIAEAMSAAA
jgi:hypothetical protein